MRVALGLFVAACVAGTWWLFSEGLPGIADTPGWFYAPADRPVGGGALGLGLALVCAALVLAGLAAHRAGRGVRALVALCAASVALQLAVTSLGGAGFAEAWDRHARGHGELWRIARLRSEEPLETLRDYDALAAAGTLGVFAPSKPPGALAIYLAVDRVARLPPVAWALSPVADVARHNPTVAPYAESAALSFLLLPLLTALVLPLLAWLVRELALAGGERDAPLEIAAALCAATVPAVLLVSYHLDGAVYPLFALGTCALAAHGARTGRVVLTFAGGATFGLGLCTSFSLAPVAALAPVLVAAVILGRARRDGGGAIVFRFLSHLAALAAGAVLVLGALRLAIDFDLVLRWRAAMAHHDLWKAAVPTELWRKWSLVELGLYAGAPLVVFACGRSLVCVASPLRPASFVALGIAATLAATAALAGTNEVARLWLFLVPFFALVAASGLVALARRARGADPVRWALAFAAAQVAITLAMKPYQPW
jgi:hypothetical protein